MGHTARESSYIVTVYREIEREQARTRSEFMDIVGPLYLIPAAAISLPLYGVCMRLYSIYWGAI